MARISCLPERTKPLKRCPGCGMRVISIGDYYKGHGREGDETGYTCTLCRKVVCPDCCWNARYVHTHNEFEHEYDLFSAYVVQHGDYICRRCVGEYEMKLIRKIGYQNLPLHINKTWLTQAAVKYFYGMLEGRYE